jgi:3'(2'), 5'-bisphosphate nucleotidase
VIVSRSHMTDDTEAFLDKLRKKFKNIESISIGSSMKLCAIAEGRADVYPRFAPTMEWDTAAGQAIIEQSGGFFAKAGTLESFEYNKKSLVNPWFIAVGDKKFIEL